jgi:hypothetical protein
LFSSTASSAPLSTSGWPGPCHFENTIHLIHKVICRFFIESPLTGEKEFWEAQIVQIWSFRLHFLGQAGLVVFADWKKLASLINTVHEDQILEWKQWYLLCDIEVNKENTQYS